MSLHAKYLHSWSRGAVFLGYAEQSIAYKCLNGDKREIGSSKDVTCDKFAVQSALVELWGSESDLRNNSTEVVLKQGEYEDIKDGILKGGPDEGGTESHTDLAEPDATAPSYCKITALSDSLIISSSDSANEAQDKSSSATASSAPRRSGLVLKILWNLVENEMSGEHSTRHCWPQRYLHGTKKVQELRSLHPGSLLPDWSWNCIIRTGSQLWFRGLKVELSWPINIPSNLRIFHPLLRKKLENLKLDQLL